MPNGRIRVLIIDDNREFTDVVRDFIAMQSDMEIVGVAYNGVDGLEKIAETEPDVIILDLIMPHLDGIGVLERLSAINLAKEVRVIALTAIGHEAVAARVVTAGADYYLVKPFDLQVLVERIRGLVRPVQQTQIQRNPTAKKRDLEADITKTIYECGVPANIRGYAYLRDAITMFLHESNVLGNITKKVYPKIAAKYDTTPARVERAIRHAIEVAWSRGNVDMLNNMFGHTIDMEKGKPTNAAFIARVADQIRIDMKY